MVTASGTTPAEAVLSPTEVNAARATARLVRFAERALGELSLSHYRVLSAIASGDERATRVAARFSLGKPAISATVEALCWRGLVSRSTAGDDQRATALALTAEGRRVLDVAERSLVTRLRELGAEAGDAAHVIDMLASLGAALEQEAQARNRASIPDGTAAGAHTGRGAPG